MRIFNSKFFKINPFYYDGEEESNEEGGGNEEPNNPVTPTPTPSSNDNNNNKGFSQEEVNALLAKERRKLQGNNEKTIKELEALKKTAQLTQEEKERVEQRIEDLRNEYLTKEQLDKKKRKEEEDRTKKEKDELSKDRDHWKTLYEVSTIERELVDAAIKGDSYNPDQVLQILKPNTRLVEELDQDNRPTGRFVSKVRLAGKDKDGKTVVLDLTPTEAVKQMKEMDDIYGNLFKSGARGGVGGNNNSSYSRGSGGPPLNDPVAYREWRKRQQIASARRVT